MFQHIDNVPIFNNKHKPKQKFTEDEDKLIVELVKLNGERGWKKIAEHIPFRTARQCRERWKNYLSPQVSQLPWTLEEDLLLKKLLTQLGQQWSKISSYFPKRTDVMLKNRWALLKRRMIKNGLIFYNSNQNLILNQPKIIKNFDIPKQEILKNDEIENLEQDSEKEFDNNIFFMDYWEKEESFVSDNNSVFHDNWNL